MKTIKHKDLKPGLYWAHQSGYEDIIYQLCGHFPFMNVSEYLTGDGVTTEDLIFVMRIKEPS